MPNYRPIAEAWSVTEAGRRASLVGLTSAQARRLYLQISEKRKERLACRVLRDPLAWKREGSVVYEWQEWFLPRLLGTLPYRALTRSCRVTWDFDYPGVTSYKEVEQIPIARVRSSRSNVVRVHEFHFSDDWFETVKRRTLTMVGGNLVVWASPFDVEHKGNTYVRIKLVRQSRGALLKCEDATVRRVADNWELVRLTGVQKTKLRQLELESMNGPITDSSGTTTYYLNSVVHRDNGPAIITAQGRKKYIRNGKEFRPTRYQRGEIVDAARDVQTPSEVNRRKARKIRRRILRMNRYLDRVERENQSKRQSKCHTLATKTTLSRSERVIRNIR